MIVVCDLVIVVCDLVIVVCDCVLWPYNCVLWPCDCVLWPCDCVLWPYDCVLWPCVCVLWPCHCVLWPCDCNIILAYKCLYVECYIWKGGLNPNLTAHHTSQVYSQYTDLNYDILYHQRVSRNLWQYMVRCSNKLSRRRFHIDNFIMERRTSLFHQNDTITFLQCEKSDTIKSVYMMWKGTPSKAYAMPIFGWYTNTFPSRRLPKRQTFTVVRQGHTPEAWSHMEMQLNSGQQF